MYEQYGTHCIQALKDLRRLPSIAAANTSKAACLTVALCLFACCAGGPAWGDNGRFKVEMGLAGVGSSTDTFGLICSASGANPPALSKQRAARLKLIPTGTPGVYKHVFNSARTPHLSYLADTLNAKLKDIISDNINVLPTKEVVRKEDLTAAEVSQWKCTTQRFFGCIVKIEPANCLSKCQVTRLLLNPTASLNGLRLTIRAPATVATVPTGSTALATLGDVAALSKFQAACCSDSCILDSSRLALFVRLC